MTDGAHSTPKYAYFGVPFLSVRDISSGKIDFSSTKFISEEEHSELYKRCNPQKGDLLLTKVGTTGIPVIVDTNQEFSLFVSVALLKISQQNTSLKYLQYLIQSPLVYQQSQENTRGVGNKNWVLTAIANTLIAIPPLAEQQRIVAKVDELMAMCDELEAAEKELDKLEADFAEYLPKSILQMAVQGKLVPQDLHDEPASELLKRIRAEKAQLIKDGKIKKEKPLPPIVEDDVPYDLPDSWIWCRLGAVCDYGSANNIDPTNISDNAWLLELEDIEKDTGTIKNIVTKKSRSSKSTKHIFEKGNVLYSKLRPYLNKVVVAEQDGYCTSEILPLDFLEINPYYALWFMRSPLFVDYANSHSYGVKMPRLGTEDGRTALFPLPPIAEQKRIVAKADELMALCDELKATKDISLTTMTPKVIPFPVQESDNHEEIGIAARGDVQGLSDEAIRDIDELFGDDAND